MIFDNTKIKRLVPDYVAAISFARGAKEIIAWHDADPARRPVDARFDVTLDRMIEGYQAAWPKE